MAIRFVTVDELVYINEQTPTIGTIHRLLKGKDRVRDGEELQRAVGRPTISIGNVFPTLEVKAAALLDAVARYHPFADGNKRTAAVGAIFFLAVNGRRVVWDAEEALARIITIAEGRGDVHAFGAWIATEPCEPALAPDAERDKALIAEITATHSWLLEQLAIN